MVSAGRVRAKELAVVAAIAVASVVAASSASTAVAADIGPSAPMPAKVQPFTAPYYNWSGFYIGGHVGGGWASTVTTDPKGTAFAPPGGNVNVSGSGFLGGGQFGYNYQTGRWVFGIEGDVSYSNVRGSTTSGFVVPNPNVGLSTRLDWLSTVTGRVGYALNDTLIYGKAGAAFGGLSLSMNSPKFGSLSSSDTQTGWTVGAGLEHALWDNWTVKAEYDYLDLGTHSITAAPSIGNAITADAKVTEHMIKLGANYHFSPR